ncbi:Germin-like protein 9-3 [Platanthera zijinensis]|uniref:Germin-like protein n=1 Tax=Platanthera zijinensis TaxID=2320716 RepID=A0AAP0C0A2_9ASPA
MASKSSPLLLPLLILFLSALLTARADPDITSDFIVPPGAQLNSSLFTLAGLNQTLSGGPKNTSLEITKVSQLELPVLAGQSVSLAILQFAPNGTNPLHTHPRSAELLLLLQGTLSVGFVDSGNRAYTQVLYEGDVFLFPKGLVHFQTNLSPELPAVAVSAFGSSNAGLVSLPKALFGSGVGEGVLANSFKTDATVIETLVSANMG